MIEQLSWHEFLARTDEFDEHVTAMPDISTVCAGSDWQLAAYHALHDPRETSIWKRDDCWFLGTIGKISPFERTLQPFELAWAFGSPLICPTPEAGAAFLCELLATQGHQWQLAFVSGIPRGSALQEVLLEALGSEFHLDQFEGSHCMQSLLHKGPDAFLAQRKPRFRANLRRAARRAAEAGITFEWCGGESEIDPEALLRRAMKIEERSWKFAAGTSIFLTQRYTDFYQQISAFMAPKRRLRALFAQQEGEDVAYVFGGVMGHVYRGFQLSYDELLAHLSLGHLVQWELIQRLAQEDGVTLYDLGMAMDYKLRWSDRLLEIDNIAVFL